MEGWTLTDEGWNQREVERIEEVGVRDLKILLIPRIRHLKPHSWMYNFVEVSGHEFSDLWFPYAMFKLQNSFKQFLLGWGGGGVYVKSISRGDCEKQGGKFVRLLSQLRPRIRPLHCLKTRETSVKRIQTLRPRQRFSAVPYRTVHFLTYIYTACILWTPQ